jgi:hypothetical protein
MPAAMIALDFDDMRSFADNERPGLDPALALPLLELRHGHDYPPRNTCLDKQKSKIGSTNETSLASANQASALSVDRNYPQ